MSAVINFQSYLYNIIKVSSNVSIFNCNIIYKYKRGTFYFDTTGWFQNDTMSFGHIRLAERGELTANIFHLDFDQKYQNYSFNGHSLVICGKSDKMMGEYEVIITPISPAANFQ